jgi:hypothetical protein
MLAPGSGTHDRARRDSAIDYENLSVKRNAPHWIKALRRCGLLPAPA